MDIYFPDDVELQSSETAIYITYTIGGSTVHVGNIHLHISTYRTYQVLQPSQVPYISCNPQYMASRSHLRAAVCVQNWPSVFPSPILRDPLLPACMAPMMPSM